MEKLAFVLNSFADVGGAEVIIRRILQSLDFAEYAITVFLPDNQKLKEKEKQLFQVKYYDAYLCTPKAICFPVVRWWEKIRLTILLQKYDAVHFQMLHTVMMLYPFFSHRNAVASARGGDIQDPGKTLYKQIVEKSKFDISYKGFRTRKRHEKFLHKFFKRYKDRLKFTTISEDMMAEFKAFGVENCVLTRPCVDLAYFKKAQDAVHIINDKGNCFYALCVGRLDSRKGFHFVIEAAEFLKQKGMSKIKFLMRGRGMARIHELAQKYGVADYFIVFDPAKEINTESIRILYTETLEDKKTPDLKTLALYKMADAVVIPSLIEGASNVGAEALAAGKPLIVSDTFGCRDWAKIGGALMSIPGNGESIAKQLIRLYEDTKLYNNLCEKQKSERYRVDLNVMIDQYLRLYV